MKVSNQYKYRNSIIITLGSSVKVEVNDNIWSEERTHLHVRDTLQKATTSTSTSTLFTILSYSRHSLFVKGMRCTLNTSQHQNNNNNNQQQQPTTTTTAIATRTKRTYVVESTVRWPLFASVALTSYTYLLLLLLLVAIVASVMLLMIIIIYTAVIMYDKHLRTCTFHTCSCYLILGYVFGWT